MLFLRFAQCSKWNDWTLENAKVGNHWEKENILAVALRSLSFFVVLAVILASTNDTKVFTCVEKGDLRSSEFDMSVITLGGCDVFPRAYNSLVVQSRQHGDEDTRVEYVWK